MHEFKKPFSQCQAPNAPWVGPVRTGGKKTKLHFQIMHPIVLLPPEGTALRVRTTLRGNFEYYASRKCTLTSSLKVMHDFVSFNQKLCFFRARNTETLFFIGLHLCTNLKS